MVQRGCRIGGALDDRRDRWRAPCVSARIAGQPRRARCAAGARKPPRSHLRIRPGYRGRACEPGADRRGCLLSRPYPCARNLWHVGWRGDTRVSRRYVSPEGPRAGEPGQRRAATGWQSHGELRSLGHRQSDVRVPARPLRHQGCAAGDQEGQASGTLRTPTRNGAMNPPLAKRWGRLGYAAAAGAGIGSFLFWAAYWVNFVRGNLAGPDFFSFYAAARLYVLKGGSAVYDLALQKEFELQVTGQPPDRFIVLPYFHPPYYTLLIAPLAALSYRQAYYAMAAFNLLLTIVLIGLLVRNSLSIHRLAAIVAAAMIAGFFPLFVTVLQGQSDLVVLLPLAAAYIAGARGRHGWAGVFSALVLAKPQLLLLIPVLFLARRAWRALAGFVAVVAALGLVSVVGFGFSAVWAYLGAVGTWAIGGRLPAGGELVYTDTAVYSLRNILEALPGGGKAVALVVLVLLLGLGALWLSL